MDRSKWKRLETKRTASVWCALLAVSAVGAVAQPTVCAGQPHEANSPPECGYTSDVPADFSTLGSLHAFTTAPPYDEVSKVRRRSYEAEFLASRNDLDGLAAIRREIEALLPSLDKEETDEANDVLHDITWLEFKLTGDQSAKKLWLSYRKLRDWEPPKHLNLDNLLQVTFADEATALKLFSNISDNIYSSRAKSEILRMPPIIHGTLNIAPLQDYILFMEITLLRSHYLDAFVERHESYIDSIEDKISVNLNESVWLCFPATYSRAARLMALLLAKHSKAISHGGEGQRAWQEALDYMSAAQATADFDASRVEWGLTTLIASYVYEAYADWLPDDNGDEVRRKAYYSAMAEQAYKDGSEFVSPNHIALPFKIVERERFRNGRGRD